MNAAHHKIVNLLKPWRDFFVIMCRSVFNVWPKTILLGQPRDAQSLDAPGISLEDNKCLGKERCVLSPEDPTAGKSECGKDGAGGDERNEHHRGLGLTNSTHMAGMHWFQALRGPPSPWAPSVWPVLLGREPSLHLPRASWQDTPPGPSGALLTCHSTSQSTPPLPRDFGCGSVSEGFLCFPPAGREGGCIQARPGGSRAQDLLLPEPGV